MTMHRILVPLDRSPLAEAVLPIAVELGRRLDADWVLLTAVEPFPPSWALVDGWSGTAAGWGEADTDLEVSGARQYLVKVRDSLAVPPDRVRLEVRVRSAPAAILEVARECGATWIAMSTHGRGGFHRLVMGSVAEHVIRLSPVPVAVVRPEGIDAAAVHPLAPEVSSAVGWSRPGS